MPREGAGQLPALYTQIECPSAALWKVGKMAQIRRHPLVTFFLLVFILTWVVWVPRASGAPLGVVGQAWTWIPAIAALLAAALTGGRGGLTLPHLRSFRDRCFFCRFSC